MDVDYSTIGREYNYIAANTGYIYRLEGEDNSRVELLKEYLDFYDIKALSAYDDKGVIEFEDGSERDTSHVISTLDNVGLDTEDIIVFKLESMYVKSIHSIIYVYDGLVRADYCAISNINDVSFIDDIIYLHLEAESG